MAALAGCRMVIWERYLPHWIKRRAEFGFDKEIEKLRGEISAGEARLTAQLNAKQSDIDHLRQVAVSGATSSQIALDNRRLQAAEGIWENVLDLRKLKMASMMAGITKLEALAHEVSKNPQLKEIIGIFGQGVDAKSLPGARAELHRPFVSEPVWAYYSALAAILHFGHLQFKAVQTGLPDMNKFFDHQGVDKLAIAALPHCEDFVKTHGPSGYHLLVDQLEANVLREIRNMLEGKASDTAAVARAAGIMSAVNEVHAAAEKAKLGGLAT
ncbi:MAG: hypothetical protein V4601_11775 [Pseudomonadota bacterium]